MAFTTADPRASLASMASSTPTVGAAAPEYHQFEHLTPSATGPTTWDVRAQNLTLSHSRLDAGQRLTETGAAHEYVVLFTDADTHARVTAGGRTETITEPALVVVPPGDSVIEALGATSLTRLFDVRDADRAAGAINAESYAEPHANVAPLSPWPDPPGGPALRVYHPERVEAEPGRFGRIYRTSAFMINFLDDQHGPRDTEALSPHHHDDFEQISLVVEGEYVHHIRTPWTPKQSEWRADHHQHVGSPSATIIPPPTVHTSEARSAGRNRLIDIFSPPREDFSAKAGWVLNAGEYPRPDGTP